MALVTFSILECPAAISRGETAPLIVKGGGLYSDFCDYPIKDGVPDMRLPGDRGITSYDAILPEWSAPEVHDPVTMLTPYGITPDMVTRKRVCVVGLGNGTQLLALSALGPSELHALDFSNYVYELAKNHRNARFYQGDACNLPFRKGVFDLVVAAGVIQHTRSPELAVRSMLRSLAPAGALSIANTYPQGLHNRRVTASRALWDFHRMPVTKAKRLLKIQTSVYTFLARTGLWRLHRRHSIPWVIEFSNLPGKSWQFYYENALDYYLCTYRHIISFDEIERYGEQVGAVIQGTPKGALLRPAPSTRA